MGVGITAVDTRSQEQEKGGIDARGRRKWGGSRSRTVKREGDRGICERRWKKVYWRQVVGRDDWQYD